MKQIVLPNKPTFIYVLTATNNMHLCECLQYQEMEEMAQAKRKEVRKIILDIAASPDLPPKLELVDTLQRIGVAYHYCKEIDELLRDVHENSDIRECDDLRIAALRFYLLRTHGYHVSPGNQDQ